MTLSGWEGILKAPWLVVTGRLGPGTSGNFYRDAVSFMSTAISPSSVATASSGLLNAQSTPK
jgi:hypothetical protein